MPRDTRGYLEDIRVSGERILSYVTGKTLSDYLNDDMLRGAIERNFEIIGEAMAQLRKWTPEIAGRFSHARDIAAFRNQLAHAYSTI